MEQPISSAEGARMRKKGRHIRAARAMDQAMIRSRRLLAAGLLSLLVLDAGAARADPPWSASFPEIAERVRAKKTLVIQVMVPLCSREQIHCGGPWAGHPAGLRTNIYWGAI